MFEKIPNQRAVRFGSNIYPDPDDFEYENILSRYGVSVSFLYENGVLINYPANLEPKETPGDVSFYSVVDKSRILTFTENFGCIEIYGPETRNSDIEEDPICVIKIVDDYYNISEKPIILQEDDPEEEEAEEDD